MTTSRRQLLAAALALGATAAFGSARAAPSRRRWTERRDLYPEGVASGDPTFEGFILWTRRPPAPGEAAPAVTVEVAEDEAFQRVVATAPAVLDADTDWTCRVLVGGLTPSRTYWYRFTDAAGNGSRMGRTRTAPALADTRPVNFTFVSCQNVNQGAQNAWRKMIWEDEKAARADQLDFVLHLGDFIYEIVWYPEDRPQGMYDRRLRDIVRYESGEKVSDFHVPTTLADYRAVYKAYLHDPDIQDARARWPFVAMWDNHEFSWRGYQSVQKFGASVRPAQTRKVAANQAWFEFQPARVAQPNGALDRFSAPKVADAPLGPVDDHGLIQEPNNLAAIASLKAYRALRFGANVDLIITDQHSYRTDDPTDGPAADPFNSPDFPDVVPEEILAIFDAGRDYPGGAPATIPFGAKAIPNPCKDRPQATLLGAEQKAWFLERLAASKATWKVWGNSEGTLDMRTDFQNLPPDKAASAWPGLGYASFGGGDWSGYVGERAQIYDFVRDKGITGFATVSGDRHSFWAGLASKALPPQPFEPVGVAFITGSISAPGLVEAYKHRKPGHPLSDLYSHPRQGSEEPDPTVNMLIKHGVASVLEYLATGDAVKARAKSNPDVSPHLSFLDMGGHGYVKVTASAQAFDTEFVCIPRPLEAAGTPEGGPLAYRVRHSARLWSRGERPALTQRIVEGDPKFSI